MPNAVSSQSKDQVYIKDIIERNNKTKAPKVAKRGSNGTLNKDAFLKLLVTKLSKQDPLKPVSDENFIAQMAQFSALEQMNNVSKNMGTVANKMLSLEANDALGKHVTGKDYLTGNMIRGKVTRVRRVNAETIILTVNNRTMHIKDVDTVFIPDDSSAQMPNNVSRETFNQAQTMKASPVQVKAYNDNQSLVKPTEQGGQAVSQKENNQGINAKTSNINNAIEAKQNINKAESKSEQLDRYGNPQTKGAQL